LAKKGKTYLGNLRDLWAIEKNPRKGLMSYEWAAMAYTLFTLLLIFFTYNFLMMLRFIYCRRRQSKAQILFFAEVQTQEKDNSHVLPLQ